MDDESDDTDEFARDVKEVRKRLLEAIELLEAKFGEEVANEAFRRVAEERLNLDIPTEEEVTDSDNPDDEEIIIPDSDDEEEPRGC